MAIAKGTWLANNKVPVLTTMAIVIAALGLIVTAKNLKKAKRSK